MSEDSKTKPPVKSIGVHDGLYHADDVFGTALLLVLYPEAKIVRTRDMSILDKCDILIDVGGEYDPSKGRFDHHMEDARKNASYMHKGRMEEGPTMSGFGLVWDHFGKEVIETYLRAYLKDPKKEFETGLIEAIHSNIKTRIVIPVDIEDNAEYREYYGNQPSPYRPVGLNVLLQAFLPPLQEDPTKDESDEAFGKAVRLATQILKKQITSEFLNLKDIPYIKDLILNNTRPNILVVPRPASWVNGLNSAKRNSGEHMEALAKGILHIIYPVKSYNQKDQSWMMQPTKEYSYETRKMEYISPIPDELRGLEEDELKEMTGLKSMTFVHPSGFLAGASNLDELIRFAEMTVANSFPFQEGSEENTKNILIDRVNQTLDNT